MSGQIEMTSFTRLPQVRADQSEDYAYCEPRSRCRGHFSAVQHDAHRGGGEKHDRQCRQDVLSSHCESDHGGEEALLPVGGGSPFEERGAGFQKTQVVCR